MGRMRRKWRATMGMLLAGGVPLLACLLLPFTGQAEEQPKSTRMTCGACPSGYAKTGVTAAPEICKEGDPTLVECVPIGSMNLMAVCGSCPDGYRQVGGSNVPVRCGNEDGGRMSQCQLEKLENTMPDPTQGGRFCPPNCAGSLPTPGQGTMPLPPKYGPSPKESK